MNNQVGIYLALHKAKLIKEFYIFALIANWQNLTKREKISYLTLLHTSPIKFRYGGFLGEFLRG